ncbi:O-antigen ligase [Acinetobacter sp. YH12237]|uniref:O-antigen ligase family protein n=1 Tax=Acinetobacter sp. YH12237 TaxID=2601164 RepID=UPI0015D3D248|nr:O-antigen ligase family protein [Acinetobacter sp. YH12237]
MSYSTFLLMFLEHKKKHLEYFLLILCLLPIYNIIIFFISLFNGFYTHILIGWHGWADNYRFFDSMIILPIFLCLYFVEKKHKLGKTIYFLFYLYILTLFFDGARSVLLSIAISIIMGYILFKKRKKIFLDSLFIMCFAYISHFIYLKSSNLTINSIARGDSSGRFELWNYGFNRFLEKPFFGYGGGNFSLDSKIYLSSPHNFIIQFISEWGLGGIGLVILVLYLYWYLFKNLKKLNPFIFLCSISILIDGLFSGLFILPMSQMNFMLVIGLLLNQIYICNKKEYIVGASYSGYFFYILIIFCTVYFFVFHWQDIICTTCMGLEGVNTPRFWRGGKSLHLQEID